MSQTVRSNNSVAGRREALAEVPTGELDIVTLERTATALSAAPLRPE